MYKSVKKTTEVPKIFDKDRHRYVDLDTNEAEVNRDKPRIQI